MANANIVLKGALKSRLKLWAEHLPWLRQKSSSGSYPSSTDLMSWKLRAEAF